jgi:hypothetical protein
MLPKTTPAVAIVLAAVAAACAGRPEGVANRGTASDAGSPLGDSGVVDPTAPAPTTCASGTLWTQGNRGSNDMNPGQPCLACHVGPGGGGPAMRYMGTAYPALHEKDNCNARPTGTVTVEILDSNDAVVEVIPVSPLSGNFASARTGASVAYRARVKVDGAVTSAMASLQTNGDCNACHTEQGTNGAPGRVTY